VWNAGAPPVCPHVFFTNLSGKKNTRSLSLRVSSSDSELPAVRIAPVVMPVTTTVTEVQMTVGPGRNVHRRRINHRRRRCGHVHHGRRRIDHTCGHINHRCWSANHGRGRMARIRDVITCGVRVHSAGQNDSGGHACENFTDRGPLAISGAGGLCCNGDKCDDCCDGDDLFHNDLFVFNCLSTVVFPTTIGLTGRFKVYSAGGIPHDFSGLWRNPHPIVRRRRRAKCRGRSRN
jgi:hypothetical protein